MSTQTLSLQWTLVPPLRVVFRLHGVNKRALITHLSRHEVLLRTPTELRIGQRLRLRFRRDSAAPRVFVRVIVAQVRGARVRLLVERNTRAFTTELTHLLAERVQRHFAANLAHTRTTVAQVNELVSLYVEQQRLDDAFAMLRQVAARSPRSVRVREAMAEFWLVNAPSHPCRDDLLKELDDIVHEGLSADPGNLRLRKVRDAVRQAQVSVLAGEEDRLAAERQALDAARREAAAKQRKIATQAQASRVQQRHVMKQAAVQARRKAQLAAEKKALELAQQACNTHAHSLAQRSQAAQALQRDLLQQQQALAAALKTVEALNDRGAAFEARQQERYTLWRTEQERAHAASRTRQEALIASQEQALTHVRSVSAQTQDLVAKASVATQAAMEQMTKVGTAVQQAAAERNDAGVHGELQRLHGELASLRQDSGQKWQALTEVLTQKTQAIVTGMEPWREEANQHWRQLEETLAAWQREQDTYKERLSQDMRQLGETGAARQREQDTHTERLSQGMRQLEATSAARQREQDEYTERLHQNMHHLEQTIAEAVRDRDMRTERLSQDMRHLEETIAEAVRDEDVRAERLTRTVHRLQDALGADRALDSRPAILPQPLASAPLPMVMRTPRATMWPWACATAALLAFFAGLEMSRQRPHATTQQPAVLAPVSASVVLAPPAPQVLSHVAPPLPPPAVATPPPAASLQPPVRAISTPVPAHRAVTPKHRNLTADATDELFNKEFP